MQIFYFNIYEKSILWSVNYESIVLNLNSSSSVTYVKNFKNLNSVINSFIYMFSFIKWSQIYSSLTMWRNLLPQLLPRGSRTWETWEAWFADRGKEPTEYLNLFHVHSCQFLILIHHRKYISLFYPTIMKTKINIFSPNYTLS